MNKYFWQWASVGLFLLGPVTQIIGMETTSSSTTVIQQDSIKSDEDITKAVKQAILGDKELAKLMNQITVKSEKGVVTLSGSVDNSMAKSNLEAKAKAVLGVQKVVNNIEVKS